ncbi:MAG: iron-sulfur cluster repair di-iron protein [Bacteroidetes bacterium]|nr:iron-sulfur cluster repair di-iron protein [Bacteroidota bacterium]
MEITKNLNIGALVARNYKTASVFKKSGIDFCCNGNRTIEEACNQKKINVDELIKSLQNVIQNTNNSDSIDFNSWPLDLLADYIEKKHHRFVESKIIEITPFLNKIVKVHGPQHPELNEVQVLFQGCVEELTVHMKKEELIIFPFIRKLEAFKQSGGTIKIPFGSVQNPIQNMMNEHTAEGERFRKIAELTNDYTPPKDACNTYKVTFSLLKEFEEDLHQHIHLENNILFPKAIFLEEDLMQPNCF